MLCFPVAVPLSSLVPFSPLPGSQGGRKQVAKYRGTSRKVVEKGVYALMPGGEKALSPEGKAAPKLPVLMPGQPLGTSDLHLTCISLNTARL